MSAYYGIMTPQLVIKGLQNDVAATPTTHDKVAILFFDYIIIIHIIMT